MDIDGTGIVSQKESAKMTYKGYPGYTPRVGPLAKNGLVVRKVINHCHDNGIIYAIGGDLDQANKKRVISTIKHDEWRTSRANEFPPIVQAIAGIGVPCIN